jgi:hypothetical protein
VSFSKLAEIERSIWLKRRPKRRDKMFRMVVEVVEVVVVK